MTALPTPLACLTSPTRGHRYVLPTLRLTRYAGSWNGGMNGFPSRRSWRCSGFGVAGSGGEIARGMPTPASLAAVNRETGSSPGFVLCIAFLSAERLRTHDGRPWYPMAGRGMQAMTADGPTIGGVARATRRPVGSTDPRVSSFSGRSWPDRALHAAYEPHHGPLVPFLRWRVN